MVRNQQVPRRSGSAIGVASEVILRATAWRHPQWHQVGSRGILLRASSALRTRVTTGVIVVLEGGDLPRVADLRGPLLLLSAAPGFEEQSRVLRIGVGWSGSTTDCAGGREFDHCFGAGGGAGGAVRSSAGRDACRCTGGELTKSVVCWLVVVSSRRAVCVLWGVSACAACAAVASIGDRGASKCG